MSDYPVPLSCLLWTFVITAIVMYWVGWNLCAHYWRRNGKHNVGRKAEARYEIVSNGEVFTVEWRGTIR